MNMLPQIDANYLTERYGNGKYTVAPEANMICLVLHDFLLPPGFDREKVELLIRLQAGYPDVPPDMWWFDPPVRGIKGQTIRATEVIEQHLGRGWQRWSRHIPAGQWRSGIDGIESYLALLRKELSRSVPGPIQ
jgi:Prokaryotic E2 family E